MISHITDDIWISDYLDAGHLKDPSVYKIQLCHPIIGLDPEADEIAPLADGTSNDIFVVRRAVDTVKEAIARLDDPDNPQTVVLVYCRAGLSRSPCITAKAMSELEDIPFDEALENIRRVRVSIKPNPILLREVKKC